ncbi:MAG: hypothetical protein HZB16_21210 [Armatimonadetes bacterium]|nr:hypothetical protein [Armatimonadota bacterium]
MIPLLLTTALAANAPIRAFCIDFNWGPGGPNGFAKPGLWADVSPADSLAWHAALGANVIQTFAVSCNGYAWYKGGQVPPQPGLRADFLPELVKLAHARDMRVMGYFCVGSNTRWGAEHPDLSYGTPSAPHIPFTTAYLDFLCAEIEESLRLSGMDGFMIDWVWNPTRPVKDGVEQWLPSEQAAYAELMGKPFPGADKLGADDRLAYHRRAIDRCWARIRQTAKQARPDCVIWLSCHSLADPTVAGSPLLREVDWLMNENPNPADLAAARASAGPNTTLVQCLVGWGDAHDAQRVLLSPEYRDLAVYGFAKPGDNGFPLPVADYLAQPIRGFRGNDRNIAVLARWFTGRPIDEPAPLVTQAADGQLALTPDNAKLVGMSPVVMDGQIGHWGNVRDSVTWRLRVDRPGDFDLVLTYAVATGMAGSRFAVLVDERRYEQTAVETGPSWREYRAFGLGRVALAAGEHTVSVVPDPAGPWRAISLKGLVLAAAR